MLEIFLNIKNTIALAHDNYSHFAWHNIKKYVELHTKALWYKSYFKNFVSSLLE